MSLSKNGAFYLQASIIGSFLAGSSAPTPLYAVYQSAWGFSALTVTVVFAAYAVAVLASLLVLGSVSDYVGRRPVLLAAALLQAVTMVVFAMAHGVGTLVTARVLQGLATGAAAGAVGAGMLDINRVRGATANAIGPLLGTATGGIAAGVLVQYLPAPTVLIYAVLGVTFVAQALGVWLMSETAARRTGALAALRPHFRLPPAVRRPMLLAAPALIGTWSLAGFYGSLGPTLLRRLVGSTTPSLAGLALFALAGSGAVTVLLTRTRAPATLMKLGTASLSAGVAGTLVAVGNGSIAGFFLGTAVAGAGFGAAFQGAVRSVLPLAAAHERAGVLSVLYVIAYLAMGVPAVLGGIGVARAGVLTTAREYGSAVIVLGLLALAGSSLQRSPRAVRVLASEADAVPSRP